MLLVEIKASTVVCAIIALISFSSSSGLAASCTEIDIRNQGSLELRSYFKKPIDQSQIRWCGRYTANELLSQKVGRPLSAHYTGILSLLQGNATGKPFYRLKDQVLNDEESVKRTLLNMAHAGRACPASVISGQGEVSLPYAGGELLIGNLDFFQSLHQLQQGKCGPFCQDIVRLGSPNFIGPLSLESITQFVGKYPNLPIENVIISFMDYSCKNNFVKIPGNLQVATYRNLMGDLDAEPLAKIVDNVLESGRMVGISYIPDHILKPAYIQEDGFHASVIVGRKNVDGQCRYIIRNTWGDSCKYNSKAICDSETGSFMVTRETLKKMSVVVDYIR